MKFAMRRIILSAVAFMLIAPAVQAQDYRAGSLEISQTWTRATPKGAKVGGGYVAIRNAGDAPDRLLGGSFTPAKRVEVHTMSMQDGVMRMREVRDGVEIKPGETVELKPGGYHLMFMNLEKPLTAGERVKGELRFEKAGSVPVEFEVRAMGGQSQHEHGKH